MAKVEMSTTLNVPAEVVWNLIGGFGSLARWHPAASACEEKREGGARVRHIAIAGGGSIVERLESHDDKARSYSYSIVESPLPVKGYLSQLSVRVKEPGKSCTVEWSSEFEPDGAPESAAAKVVRGIYEAGFKNLQKMFGT
jgi:uncharacterized protein YndB with AHSA1/START domain